MKSYSLWDYTSNEIRAMAPGMVAVVPVGAVEQHGPHLPLGTDSIIVSAFAKRIEQRFGQENYPALFLPLSPYGKSNEHQNYPGTITYSAQTYQNVLMDIGRSCARAGFPKVVFLNAHGGNSEMLAVVTRELRIETGIKAFSIQPSLLPRDRNRMGCEQMTASEIRYGIHGGLVETSAILCERGELVKTELLQDATPTCFDQTEYLDFSGRMAFGWITEDVTKTGAVGNPEHASAQQGERWLTYVTGELYKAFLDILAY